MEQVLASAAASRPPQPGAHQAPQSQLSGRYQAVRRQTGELAKGLSDADATVQSMEDASPAKWHLAHTTWFFETFILAAQDPDYVCFDDTYALLFNSYYEGAGERWTRHRRGLLTRPALADVRAYRAHVDAAMLLLIEHGLDGEAARLIDIGLNHERQHQELLLTDILHLFAQNPLHPAYRANLPAAVNDRVPGEPRWIGFDGGIFTAGHQGDGFAFDCETPAHEVLLRPFKLASRAVTNGEWLEFMADGGYAQPAHWLSDGIARARAEGWDAPLYWRLVEGAWFTMTLAGLQPVDPAAPVTHVSYFEADAFAQWAGKRLPTEFEWERAATGQAIAGNLAETGLMRPSPQGGQTDGALAGLFGDVWEWTASPYSPYPDFRPLPGTVGEYNGKFMSGQMVLRGGSCASHGDHLRASYRNFFQPEKRWQFSGLRLAESA